MLHKPEDFGVGSEALDRVGRPIAEAAGMPNAAYTREEAFIFEREHVFGTTWAAAAFADEVPQPRDVKPFDFMGLPLLLVRDEQGEVRVFHNVCSHRGLRLVREAKHCSGLLVCPYHSWSYALSGQLRATPHIGGIDCHKAEGFDPARHGLKPVRSAVWMGVVFINLAGQAPEFAEHIAPLMAHWRPFIGEGGLDSLRPAADHGSLQLEVNCNWKLAVENFTEAYHLPWVHPGLNSYSPLSAHGCLLIGEHASGQSCTAFNPSLDGLPEFDEFPDWPADQRGYAEYPVLYPNLLLGLQVNHTYAQIIRPVATDRVVEDVRLFYLGESAAGTDYQPSRAHNLETWRGVFVEDIESVEGMQQGRISPGYVGGAFSPVLETCSHHFHRWVAERYSQAA